MIRRVSFKAGGRVVSANDSTEAVEVADLVDIHVRTDETERRPNGRRYRYTWRGEEMPLYHGGKATENVGYLVKEHLAKHINRIDEEGMLHGMHWSSSSPLSLLTIADSC